MRPSLALFKLVRFTAPWFVATLLFDFIVMVAVPLPVGILTREFFDALAGDGRGLSVTTAIVALLGLRLFALYSGPMLANPWNAMQQKAQVLIQRNLFDAVSRSYSRHGLPISVTESISLFRDDPVAMADSLDAFADLICRLIFAAVAGALMWQIHPVMTVALLVPVLLTALIAQVLGDRTAEYHAASRQATGRLTGFLGELVGAQLAVKVAGATPRVIKRLEDMSDLRRRMSIRTAVFNEALNSIHFHLVHVATGAVLLIGARDIRNGTFTVGDFAMFVLFLDQLMYLPTEIGRLIGDLGRTEVSTSRMHELAPAVPPSELFSPAPVYLKDELPELPPAPARERLERLEVRGLTYDHHDDTTGITDVSFALERGSFTVVTGRIGSGKTTLLRVLLGLLPRDRGEIVWNGRVIDDPSLFLVPPRSAYTPQIPRLFSATLRENILLGLEGEDALRRAVDAAVLEADVASLEAGLDTRIGPRGVKLSGGQAQRTAAARMFVREPELLVFDDLSSALDAETEAELWERLFARGRDVTCLVVSHRPVALRRADQVLVMDGGRLAPE